MMIDFEKSFVFDTVPFHAAFSWEEICYFDYSSNTGIKHVRMSLFLLWYCLNIQELTKYSETFFITFSWNQRGCILLLIRASAVEKALSLG